MMEFAKKMILVPEERLSKHVPSEEQLSDLDREMKRILLMRIRDDEKIKLYNQILQKRLNMVALNPPILLNVDTDNDLKKEDKNHTDLPLDSGDDNAKMKQEEISPIDNMLLNSIPKSLSTLTNNILNILKRNPEVVSWTPRGEFIYKGNTVPDSNIVDLMNSIIRFRKKKGKEEYQPVGQNLFLTALKDLNVPKSFIKNKSIVFMQNGKGDFRKKNTPLKTFNVKKNTYVRKTEKEKCLWICL